MGVKVDKVAFEDALDMTGFGRFNILSFLLSSIVISGMSFEILSVSYLVPTSACELGTTSAQQGLMAGVPLMGIIMTSHVMGYLADTGGRRRVLMVSMSVAFVSGSLAALAPNWIVLSLLKFCSSAAVSGALAISLTLLSECTPMAYRSTLILLTTSVFLATSGIMSIVAIPVLPLKFSYYIPGLDIHFNSWRLLDLIFAVPSAIAAIGMACSYESPKYLLSIGNNDGALAVLEGIFAVNSGKSAEVYRARSVVLDEEGSSSVSVGFWASIKAQMQPMIRPPLLKDTVLLSILSIIVYICINPFMVWMPFIMNAIMVAVEKGNTSMTLCEMTRFSMNYTSVEQAEACTMNQTGMLIIFGISILIAVLNLLTSGIVNCIGRKSIFIGLQLLGGCAALFINVTTIWSLSAVLFIVYIMAVINFGNLTSFIVDIFPTYVKAMAICLTLMFGRGSGVFCISWLKSLLDNDCEAAYNIFGGFAIIGGVIGFLLPSDAALKERKETLKQKFANKT